MTSPGASPRRSRWRYERAQGLEFDRVAFFTDAVFAIAMTLLIVSIETPDLPRGLEADPQALWHELKLLIPQFISFFLAFLLLGRYWMAHHEYFAALARVDRSLITANLLYLAFVAFLPFPTALVGRWEDNPVSVVAFAICLAVISGMESVLFRIAYRHGLLRLAMSAKEYKVGMLQSSTPVLLFVVSIPIAFWSPTAALLTWLLAIPLGFALDHFMQVDSRTLLAPSGDGRDGAP
ncbi:MAG TPA: TMEM175 family protein [Actinomycetota bacterium]